MERLVTFQVHAKKVSVSGHLGENLLLNRGWARLDSLEDGRVEDVDARVDLVGNEDLGLLHELFNLSLSVWLGDNDTVL